MNTNLVDIISQFSGAMQENIKAAENSLAKTVSAITLYLKTEKQKSDAFLEKINKNAAALEKLNDAASAALKSAESANKKIWSSCAAIQVAEHAETMLKDINENFTSLVNHDSQEKERQIQRILDRLLSIDYQCTRFQSFPKPYNEIISLYSAKIESIFGVLPQTPAASAAADAASTALADAKNRLDRVSPDNRKAYEALYKTASDSYADGVKAQDAKSWNAVNASVKKLNDTLDSIGKAIAAQKEDKEEAKRKRPADAVSLAPVNVKNWLNAASPNNSTLDSIDKTIVAQKKDWEEASEKRPADVAMLEAHRKEEKAQAADSQPYYIKINTKKCGPFDLKTIKAMVKNNLITKDFYFHLKGGMEWHPIAGLINNNSFSEYDESLFFIWNDNYESGKACAVASPNRAIMKLTEAIRLNPDYAEQYYYRGLAYLHKDKADYQAALKDFEKANTLSPSEKYSNRIEEVKAKINSEFTLS